MNENEIKKVLSGADKSLPDASLLKRTETAMNGASRPETERVIKFRRPAKVMLIAAALVLSLAVLMGAGYAVFEYVYFVPGSGVIVDEFREADVFVLERAQKLGRSYIETAAITPNKDGTRTLMLWYGEGGYTNMGEWTPDKITATSDGVSYTLTETSRSSNYKIFKCTNYGGGESFTVNYLDGSSADLTLECVDKNKFAQYEYPVSGGVTVVMFPLSEGSNIYTYTIRCDFAEGNLKSLSEASRLSTSALKVTITDVEGNTYFVSTYTSSSFFNPLTDLYVTENFCYTEERPAADIASIKIDRVLLKFNDLDFAGAVDITVPEFESGVPVEKSLFNAFGVTDYGATAMLTSDFGEDHLTAFKLGYNSMPRYDFSENVSGMMIFYQMLNGDGKTEILSSAWKSDLYPQQDKEADDYSRVYTITEGEGFDYAPGDVVRINPSYACVVLSGDWNIDFTTPVK